MTITMRKTRDGRLMMPELDEFLRHNPQLAPLAMAVTRDETSFERQVRLASKFARLPGHEAERHFAAVLDAVEMEWLYEPFQFSLEMRDKGTVRGFQPDFWLPELGLLVELCSNVSSKNRRIMLMAEGWPDLQVLVLSDAQVMSLHARDGLTQVQMLAYLEHEMVLLAARLEIESDPDYWRKLKRWQRMRARICRPLSWLRLSLRNS